MGSLSCGVPRSCPPAQLFLPISQQPKQNLAEGGTAKIIVNNHMNHFVFLILKCTQNIFLTTNLAMATKELRNFTDLKGDGRLFEMCVQGFDINAEDAMLLLGLSSSKAQG